MTCNLDKTGLMTIKAETDLEGYALTKWSNEVMSLSKDIKESKNGSYYIDGSKILIDASWKTIITMLI